MRRSSQFAGVLRKLSMNPTWPPCAGASKKKQRLVSASATGKQAAGKNGSSCALIKSVGRLIRDRYWRELDRVQ